MSCGIYKITNPSGSVYVGQSRNIERRFRSYKNLNCEAQRHLHNSLKKYGFLNHKLQILELCEKEELDYREDFHIKKESIDSKMLNINKSSGERKLRKIPYERKPKKLIENEVKIIYVKDAVFCYDKNFTEERVFKDIKDASRQLDCSPTSIKDCINNKLKTYRGFIFTKEKRTLLKKEGIKIEVGYINVNKSLNLVTNLENVFL